MPGEAAPAPLSHRPGLQGLLLKGSGKGRPLSSGLTEVAGAADHKPETMGSTLPIMDGQDSEAASACSARTRTRAARRDRSPGEARDDGAGEGA